MYEMLKEEVVNANTWAAKRETQTKPIHECRV